LNRNSAVEAVMARGKSVEDGPHPVDRHVGRRVCEKRIALGYNQSDLGRAVGVTFQQIQKYEKGANRISASKLFEIARFFHTDIGYFFQGFQGAGQSGVAEEGAGFDHDFPATRQSVEIARLVPQLPPQKQKLALDLIRAIHAAKDD
jgi:transcriptional regulator with XRE-family HTH domain